MKKIGKIITILICINFIVILNLSNFLSSDENKNIFGIEFGSELESDIEDEAELKNKSQNSKLFYQECFNFLNQTKIIRYSYILSLKSYLNHVEDVLTSPPDNC